MTKTILAVASFGGHWIQLKKILSFRHVHWITTSNLHNDDKKCHIVTDCSRSTPLKAIMCSIQLIFYILKTNPHIVISTGALPGCIAILIAKLLGKKTIWIDSIANAEVISVSGKLCKPFCDIFLTQWEHLQEKDVLFKGGVL